MDPAWPRFYQIITTIDISTPHCMHCSYCLHSRSLRPREPGKQKPGNTRFHHLNDQSTDSDPLTFDRVISFVSFGILADPGKPNPFPVLINKITQGTSGLRAPVSADVAAALSQSLPFLTIVATTTTITTRERSSYRNEGHLFYGAVIPHSLCLYRVDSLRAGPSPCPDLPRQPGHVAGNLSGLPVLDRELRDRPPCSIHVEIQECRNMLR